jgi:rubrerythrin
MPQTNPFHAMVPRKLTDGELARAIRLDIEAELDAINLYQAHIEATDNAQAIRILEHVMNEEREHAALFMQLLLVLDPKQAEEAAAAGPKFRMLLAGATDEEVEGITAEEAAATPPPLVTAQLSVGSLKKAR